MDAVHLLFIVSPVLLFFIFIGLGVLRKKDHIVVEYGGKSETYTLDEKGIKNIKKQLFDHLGVNPDEFERELKMHHSIEKTPIGTIKIDQYKHVDLHSSLNVPFAQHDEYIEKINSAFLEGKIKTKRKIKNPFGSLYKGAKGKISSGKDSISDSIGSKYESTKDKVSSGKDKISSGKKKIPNPISFVYKGTKGKISSYSKNNRNAKALLKKDAFTAEDYENLAKLIAEEDKLTDTNREKLHEKAEEIVENPTYDNLTDEKISKSQKDIAEKLGLQQEYDEAKKKTVWDKITQTEDIYEKDKRTDKQTAEDDDESAEDDDGLKLLQKKSKETGLEEKLIEKYIQEYETNLIDDPDKIGRLESILEDGPKIDDETIASAIKEGIIKNETKYLDSKIAEVVQDIDSTKDDETLFDKKDLTEQIKKISEEMTTFKDKEVLTKDLEKKARGLNKKIIEEFINDNMTVKLMYAIQSGKHSETINTGSNFGQLDNPSVTPEIYDSYAKDRCVDLIFDNNMKYAFTEILSNFSKTEDLAKNDDFKTLLLDKQLNGEGSGDENAFAEAILELVTYKAALIESESGKDVDIPEITSDMGKILQNQIKLFQSPEKIKQTIGGKFVPGKTTKNDIQEYGDTAPIFDAPADDSKQKTTADAVLEETERSKQRTTDSSISETDTSPGADTPPAAKDTTDAGAKNIDSDDFIPDTEKIDSIFEEIEDKGYKQIPGGDLVFLKNTYNDISKKKVLSQEDKTYFNKLNKLFSQNPARDFLKHT